MSDIEASWVDLRQRWVMLLRNGPLTLGEMASKVIGRDTLEEIASLVREGIVEVVNYDNRQSRYRLTAAGRVLRILSILHNGESGPWSLSEIRHASPRRSMALGDIEAGLDALTQAGVVKECRMPRSSKWELTGQ